jgi:hypothetical protein
VLLAMPTKEASLAATIKNDAISNTFSTMPNRE